MINPKLAKIWYGGDWNPDQWPESSWPEDVRLFRQAGIDVATLPVFSWAKLQPDETSYEFGWLDRALDLLAANGMHACLATSTAAVPAWMATRHPDVLQTTIDGRRRAFGQRHNFCPNSPTYREHAARLAGKLAERYARHPALIAWHVNNEYGTFCYCANCARAFRDWLRARHGTLEALNEAWNAAFWSHTLGDWDEVVPPSLLSEHWNGTQTTFPGITLDWYRFTSDGLLDCFRLERDAIRRHCPGVPVTTNLMGAFKGLDYFRWAREMDVVSWDSYPGHDTPVSDTALRHDLVRGLKAGTPFMLMEQTPSQQNWQPYNRQKRPLEMRLQSWQAVARGADTVMFFQLKQSRGACEKYHAAVVSHALHEHTRVFREVAALGEELRRIGAALLDARLEARIGVLFDWENWWSVDMSSGPSVELAYLDQVARWHEAFWAQNYAVDLVGLDQDFRRHDVLVAPVLHLLGPGVARRLESFVAAGGCLVLTFFSGHVDERDLVTLGGYPGELRELAGIWVEEIDALPPARRNAMVLNEAIDDLDGTHPCGLLCEVLHLAGAEAVATFASDYYAGMPCLTRHAFGRGTAWYVATAPDRTFLHAFARHLAKCRGIEPVLRAPAGVEATRRTRGAASFLFVLNHLEHPATVDLGDGGEDLLGDGRMLRGPLELPGYGVLVLREDTAGSSSSVMTRGCA